MTMSSEVTSSEHDRDYWWDSVVSRGELLKPHCPESHLSDDSTNTSRCFHCIGSHDYRGEPYGERWPLRLFCPLRIQKACKKSFFWQISTKLTRTVTFHWSTMLIVCIVLQVYDIMIVTDFLSSSSVRLLSFLISFDSTYFVLYLQASECYVHEISFIL
jgi:hypothetical protein